MKVCSFVTPLSHCIMKCEHSNGCGMTALLALTCEKLFNKNSSSHLLYQHKKMKNLSDYGKSCSYLCLIYHILFVLYCFCLKYYFNFVINVWFLIILLKRKLKEILLFFGAEFSSYVKLFILIGFFVCVCVTI